MYWDFCQNTYGTVKNQSKGVTSRDTPQCNCEFDGDHHTGDFNLSPDNHFLTYHRIGAYGILSSSERTRNSNSLQMPLQRQHFFLSSVNDPECWCGRSFYHRHPLADHPLSNRANRVVVTVQTTCLSLEHTFNGTSCCWCRSCKIYKRVSFHCK